MPQGLVCPTCEKVVTFEQSQFPTKGGAALCSYCASWATADEHPAGQVILRLPNNDEMQAIRRDPKSYEAETALADLKAEWKLREENKRSPKAPRRPRPEEF